MQKSEVREILQHAGIPCASKPDSQEICFITRGKYADYIENRLPHRIPSPGDIIDVNGKKLGRHKGLHRYTIGQRQGLGISARYPLYVVEMDPTTNVLVVGSKTDATRYSFRVINPVWSAIDSPVDAFVCEVQIRYRHTPVAAKIHPLDDGSVRVELIDKPAIIAPGQGAAFYRGDLVLGGGEIRI